MEQLINLNFAPGGLPATVHVSQYDDTIRQLRFQLWFGRSKVEVPSGASVRVDIKKPDGHIVLVNGTVNSSDRSIVTVPTTKQMTAAPGGSRGTLVVSSTGDKRISSAIFILQVHRDPVEDGDASDSDLSMLQDAIDQTAANASAAQAAATAAQQAAESLTVDSTLDSTSTNAIQNKAVAEGFAAITESLGALDDRVDALEGGGSGSGLTEDIKTALMNLVNHVTWDDDDPTGQTYITALSNALYPPIPATAISLSSNSLTINTLNSTQTLTATLTPSNSTSSVAWSSSNSAVATVNNGVVTAIGYGTATITATAGSVSATCSVIVAQVNLSSINASYTQSGTVYNTDSLNSLKADLVVTATWSDSSTSILNGADYTLSGTLTVGTSTITVSYGGKTDTFTVTVSQYDSSLYNWDFTQSLVDSKQGATATLGSGVTRGASGLTFNGTMNAYVHLADMSNYATSSFTVEVDVDTLVSGGTLVDLNTQSGMSDNPCGLIFSGHWYFRLTSNSNATIADSTLTDPTIFNGHTVKCQFDYANKLWTVYNNGTLVGSVTAYQKSNGRNQLGLSANYSSRFLGNGTVITAVRVYEGVV